jgi:thiol-disulfide isomerase/thioredoxin
MSRMFALWLGILLTVILLAACVPAMPATQNGESTAPMAEPMAEDEKEMDMATPEAMSESHTMTETETMAEDEKEMKMETPEAMSESHAMTETEKMDDAESMAAMDLPAWQTISLTDARTGESFTLADYAGRTLFVETMATWCPNCKQQLSAVKSAVATADPEKMAFIALSVETGLDASALASYADQNGFEWRFAVASAELVQALAATFGTTIVNPPSTPHFIVRSDGSYTELSTGIHSSDAILAELAAAMVQ